MTWRSITQEETRWPAQIQLLLAQTFTREKHNENLWKEDELWRHNESNDTHLFSSIGWNSRQALHSLASFLSSTAGVSSFTTCSSFLSSVTFNFSTNSAAEETSSLSFSSFFPCSSAIWSTRSLNFLQSEIESINHEDDVMVSSRCCNPAKQCKAQFIKSFKSQVLAEASSPIDSY